MLYKSTAQVTYSGQTSLASITLPYTLFPVALKEILVQSNEYNVEYYMNESGDSWTCVKKASPGRLADFEAELCKVGDLEENRSFKQLLRTRYFPDYFLLAMVRIMNPAML